MYLTLSFLGACEVTWKGESLAFASNTARALLAYLAAHADQPQTREHLAALFYPDQPQAAALVNLRSTLARVRKAVPDESGALAVTSHAITFRRRAGRAGPIDIDVDVDAFESLLAECAAHIHVSTGMGTRTQTDRATCPDCMSRLQRAAGLYRGEFLLGLSLSQSQPFEEWLLFKREQLQRDMLDALSTLARHAEAQGDYERMAGCARRAIEIDALHEEAHACVIRALALSGRHAAALTQFEGWARLLHDELGIQPSAELVELCKRIRGGRAVEGVEGIDSVVSVAGVVGTHGLPAQLTPFFGREDELAEITAQLQMPNPDARLLTLTGLGGMGKTRLAIEVARACTAAFPDRVYFVSLAALTRPSEIATAIAAALGLPPAPSELRNTLLAALRAKRALLVLDNLEHLLGDVEQSCAELVVNLLQAAPGVRILATSRERLNVRGECVIEVQGMSLAGETFAELSSAPSVRLFVQRARLGQSSFKLTEANAPHVARICRLVHGMPLGLELAAAWVGTLSIEDVASEIERSSDFLAYDWPDAPARQRSMRAVFDGSWHLLSDAEQRALRQLSVFRGGFTREAAEAVSGANWPMLARLMRKSLVRQSAVGRYDMHELVRQFAAERLNTLHPSNGSNGSNGSNESDESDGVLTRHSAWYLGQVAARERRLARDQPKEASAEIMLDLDNVRQAWTWAVARADVPGLRRATYGLWQFYHLKGYLAEGERMFALATAALVAAAAATDAFIRLASLCSAAQAGFLNTQLNYAQGLTMAERAVDLGQRSGERTGRAIGHVRLGQVLCRTGHVAEAIPHFEQALTLARSAQDAQSEDALAVQDVEWDGLLWLAHCAKEQSDPRAAAQTCLGALSFCRVQGALSGQLRCLLDMIAYSFELGDDAAANAYVRQAQALAQCLGNTSAAATAGMMQGWLCMNQDEYTSAHDAFTRVIQLNEATTSEWGLSTLVAALELARLAITMGDHAAARAWLERCVQSGNVTRITQYRMQWEMYSAQLAFSTEDISAAIAHAGASVQLAEERGTRVDEAATLLVFGRALEAAGRSSEAAEQYDSARVLFASERRPYVAVEPLAGLARLALADGDVARALVHVEAILTFLTEYPCTGLNEPFLIYVTCVRVLQAAGDHRADELLRLAHARLHAYAGRISNADLRRSYLKGVAVHRELNALWQRSHAAVCAVTYSVAFPGHDQQS